MERLTPIELQRQAIQDTLQEHCKIALDCRDTLQCDTFITSDPATDNYFMIGLDLPPKPQKYGVLIHLRLTDGKILIETNNVEDFIEDLIDRGIPETDLITPQLVGWAMPTPTMPPTSRTTNNTSPTSPN